MHLADFNSLVNKTKTLQEITHVNPANLVAFTRENQSVILSALMTGVNTESACDLAGVNKAQWTWWESLASKYIEPFYTFMVECRKASASVDVSLMQKMVISGGWKGAEVAYKIRHPEANAPVSGGPTINVNTTNNFADKPVSEKKDIIDRFKRLGNAPKVIDID